MTVARGLKSGFYRLLFGAGVLACVILAMAAAGRSFALGIYLAPVYAVFIMAFAIFGRPLRFGFRRSRSSVAGSYVIALLSVLISVFVLWFATDPAIVAGLPASR